MSALDFVAVGHLCCDVVDGRKILGGSASYASLTARKLGRSTGVMTAFGEDFPFLKSLEGISLRNIGSPTTTTFQNVYRDGVREQSVGGVAESIRADHVPNEWSNAGIVYLCPIANEVAPDILKRFSRSLIGIGAQGWLREWDQTGRVKKKIWAEADIAASLAKVVIFSELDLDEPYTLAEKIAPLTSVVVTQASRGAELFIREKRIHIPAYEITEIDPTGAGDVFAAAFLVRLKESGDPIEAAGFACCAASFVCEKEGTGGIPTLGEVLKRKEDYGARNA